VREEKGIEEKGGEFRERSKRGEERTEKYLKAWRRLNFPSRRI
jgi:hypothetical protein